MGKVRGGRQVSEIYGGTFADFYPEFKLVAQRTLFENPALKQVLRVALLREFTERLASVDVRQLSYEELQLG